MKPAIRPTRRLMALGASTLCAWTLMSAAPVALAEGRPFLMPASIARASAPIQLSGGRFEPNQALTLLVRTQGGSDVAHNAVADARGGLSQAVSVPAAGTYIVRVTDSSGRVLARAQFVAVQ